MRLQPSLIVCGQCRCAYDSKAGSPSAVTYEAHHFADTATFRMRKYGVRDRAARSAWSPPAAAWAVLEEYAWLVHTVVDDIAPSRYRPGWGPALRRSELAQRWSAARRSPRPSPLIRPDIPPAAHLTTHLTPAIRAPPRAASTPKPHRPRQQIPDMPARIPTPT
jgi:hypothetical protein